MSESSDKQPIPTDEQDGSKKEPEKLTLENIEIERNKRYEEGKKKLYERNSRWLNNLLIKYKEQGGEIIKEKIISILPVKNQQQIEIKLEYIELEKFPCSGQSDYIQEDEYLYYNNLISETEIEGKNLLRLIESYLSNDFELHSNIIKEVNDDMTHKRYLSLKIVANIYTNNTGYYCVIF